MIDSRNDQIASFIDEEIAAMTVDERSFYNVVESLCYDKPFVLEGLLLEMWRWFSTYREQWASQLENPDSFKPMSFQLKLFLELDGKLKSIAATTAVSKMDELDAID